MIKFVDIKVRISSYTLSSQIIGCLQILDGIQANKQRNYPVSNVLVLMKWIMFHSTDSELLNKAEVTDVIETLNLIDKFEYDNTLLNFKGTGEVKRSLRIIAYQQFWYQEKIRNYNFDRQVVLYTILKHKHDINKEFAIITGLSILDFLRICSSVSLYYSLEDLEKGFVYDGFLENDYFDCFKEKFDVEKLRTFFSLLSLTSIEGVASLQKMSNEVYQLYETNFLSTKPFLIVNGRYKVPHKAVFHQTSKHFIYDFCKSKSSEFSPELGRRMEKYIQLGLDEMKINYMPETIIKKSFPSITKVIDFYVDNNTLIESKAIELHPKAAVLRYSELLSSTLKDSIVKAYCQLLSTANAIDSTRSFYGIVVTYKEMYLGFGTDAWDEFLKDGVELYIKENGLSLQLLPPENLCFIDLETWDYLVQAIINYRCTIPQVVEKAKEMGKHSATRKMLLDQVLEESYQIKKLDLSYLNKVHHLMDY